MKPLLLLPIFLICSLSTIAQTKKTTVKIAKELSAQGLAEAKAKLIIKFVGPSKQPVKSHVKMIIDGEDESFPEINDKGVYSDYITPGTYKLNFSVPYWYDATIDKLKCNKNEIISLTIYFTAKEI